MCNYKAERINLDNGMKNMEQEADREGKETPLNPKGINEREHGA